MAFRFPVRVYFSDTDAGGIVYHGRYLDFAEHARTEMFRKACEMVAARDVSEGAGSSDGVSQRELLAHDTAFVVKSIAIDYQRPGLLDDLLEVVTEIEDCRRFSMTFLQRVMRGDEVLAELHVRVASISVSSHRPQPIPAWLPEIAKEL
jgi:acyl-CoA thioester hydrolase